MLESEVKKKCKEWLDKNGWFSFNIHQQGMYCYKGISDRIAIKNGRVIFIEYKSDTGRQRPEQIEFERKIKEAGGEYILVRSVEELSFYLTGERQLAWTK